MGLEELKKRGEKLLKTPILRESFYVITLTLLSLLLPLSFLLLGRLSSAQYVLSFTSYLTPPSTLLSLFLYTNPTLLHFLVSFVSVTALLRGLTGRFTLLSKSATPTSNSHLYTAWIFLCVFQVCVGLGIEGSIASGVWQIDYEVGDVKTLLRRVIFFVGLHETMLHWARAVVRPVVDDTVFGGVREERWVERVVMAASFGGLWWWRLRIEVESLVAVVEVKRELSMRVGVADLVSWWLYYLTVTIAMVKLVRGFIWLGIVLLCRRLERSYDCYCGDDDKV